MLRERNSAPDAAAKYRSVGEGEMAETRFHHTRKNSFIYVIRISLARSVAAICHENRLFHS